MDNEAIRCPSCGQLNQCAQATANAPVEHCWCFDITVDALALTQLPAEQRNRACLCPRCAQGLHEPASD
ncbi:cysteine-rich CWC family protein [Pseudomonas leptonychotis]|uniref:Helicase n=1 Tax=Pseudomonas leptonychotis TaxID=2448482 RepID=A0A4T1ZSP2_9PSED|nr:cysteine-rich CWC family protein [Pseudomonas leptonychotis]TIH07233.1 helicase [Pseudomonas leptonychotis]